MLGTFEFMAQRNSVIPMNPYCSSLWLLNAEELQAMFIDRSEYNAHNQVMAFQDTVVAEKKKHLAISIRQATLYFGQLN